MDKLNLKFYSIDEKFDRLSRKIETINEKLSKIDNKRESIMTDIELKTRKIIQEIVNDNMKDYKKLMEDVEMMKYRRIKFDKEKLEGKRDGEEILKARRNES
jgi:replicative DNA helicase